jgi:O-antigen/teichoic acid export membrane protein
MNRLLIRIKAGLKVNNVNDYLTTGIGVASAQAISLLSVPLIAKVCGVELFGEYSFLLSLISISIVFTSLRLEYTVFTIPGLLCVLLKRSFNFICIGMAIMLTFIVAIFYHKSISLYLILAVFFALFSISNFEFYLQINIKEGQFKRNSLMRVVRAISFPVFFFLLFFVFGEGVSALVFAFALSHLIPFVFLNSKSLEIYFMKYSDFILMYNAVKKTIGYLIPAHLLSRVSSVLFILLVGGSLEGGIEIAYYALAAKLLLAPAMIIVSAVSDVIKREVLIDPKVALRNYFKICIYSITFSFCAVLIVLLCSEYLIVQLMGGEWLRTIEYMEALLPILISLVIFGPITYIYVVLGMQRYDFYWQILNVVVIFVAIVWGLNTSVLHAAWAFSITYSISIMLSAIFCMFILKNHSGTSLLKSNATELL